MGDVQYFNSWDSCPSDTTYDDWREECVPQQHHGLVHNVIEFLNPASHWHTDIATSLLAATIDLALLALILALLFRLYDEIQWRKNRQHCQHEACGHQWTADISDGSHHGCLSGQPCCGDCDWQHVVDEEEKVLCPHDGTVMEKVSKRDLIYDYCRQCGCVVIDDDELRTLRQWSYDRGYDDGRAHRSMTTVAMTAGLAAGMSGNTSDGN